MAGWIERHRPGILPDDADARSAVLLSWQRQLYDAG